MNTVFPLSKKRTKFSGSYRIVSYQGSDRYDVVQCCGAIGSKNTSTGTNFMESWVKFRSTEVEDNMEISATEVDAI